MLFEEHITVETTHVAGAEKIHTIKIAHGIITWISVLFPAGCHGMVHCAIYHRDHQIAPSTEGYSIIGDDNPIEWTEYYEFYQVPYELKVKLWGVDCTYSHVITVRVAVLPRKAIIALAVIDALKGVFSIFSPKRIFTAKEEKVENGR